MGDRTAARGRPRSDDDGKERAMAGKNKGGREARKPKKDKKVKGIPATSSSIITAKSDKK